MTLRSTIVAASIALFSTAIQAATPTASEAIRAIRNDCPDLRGPITHVSCQGFGQDEPTEAVCHYRVGGKTPRKDMTYFAVDAKGWHLIDTPSYCPGAPKPIFDN